MLRTGSDLTCQLPWFLYEEFQKLQAAQRPEEVVTAAKAADNVMLLAASEAPKSQSALQFGMLEEARALREEVTVSLLPLVGGVPALTVTQTLRQRVEDGVAVQAKMLELMKAQLEALKRLAPAKGRGMKRAREVEDEGEGRGELTAPYGAEEALHVYVS